MARNPYARDPFRRRNPSQLAQEVKGVERELAQEPGQQASAMRSTPGMRNRKTVQIASALDMVGDGSGWVNTTTPFQVGWEVSTNLSEMKLWRIHSDAIYTTELVVPPAAVTPATPSQIRAGASTGVGAGTVRQGTGGTPFSRLIINAATDSGFTRFEIDVGQSVEIYATSIDVSVGAVANSIVDPQPGQTLTAPAGFETVYNALIGVSVNEVSSYQNDGSAILTERFFAATNTVVDVTIPTFAKEVTIIQRRADTNDIVAVDRAVGISGALRTGPIDLGTDRESANVRLGNEEVLVIPSIADTNFVEFIWTIRP